MGRKLIEHKVVEIIGQPDKMFHRMEEETIDYWGVPVVIEAENEKYESIVTFETLEKAQNLRIGDVFLR